MQSVNYGYIQARSCFFSECYTYFAIYYCNVNVRGPFMVWFSMGANLLQMFLDALHVVGFVSSIYYDLVCN